MTTSHHEDLKKEFSSLKDLNIKPQKDWGLIWVLSADQLDIKKDYGSQRNETRERLETGIDLVKQITALKTGKKQSQITLKNIQKTGPKIYFSGYNQHNKLMKKYLEQGYFRKRYSFPKENIIIGPLENILHTDSQFKKFPEKLIKENKKIVIVTDAYHIPRAKRYLQKYPQKFPLGSFIFFPSQPIFLTEKLIKSEINKIINYTKKGFFDSDSKQEKITVGITGASGFIGNHLLKRLELMDIKIKMLDRSGFKTVQAIVDFAKDCQVIFHLAAGVSENAADLKFNFESTKKLLQAISNVAPGCRLIFTSSFAVYTGSKYGLSKLECEKMIGTLAEFGLISAIILRLANVYGPGIAPFRHSVIATFLHQIKNNRTITINNGGLQKRDFIYIDDVIEALILASQAKTDIPTLDICSSTQTTVLELVSTIEKITGKKAKVKYLQGSEKPYLFKSDNSLAQNELGWKPKISLNQGLKLTVDSSK